MRIQQLLDPNEPQFRVIINECSQFIHESGGYPLFKKDVQMGDACVRKVKLRKKRTKQISEHFNQAFDENHPQIQQRSLVARSVVESDDGNAVCVFPIDGYKYMYNTEITDSANQYGVLFESIPVDMIPDMLKFNYSHQNLSEGLKSGAEVLLYNIPHFYAVAWTPMNAKMLTSIGAVSYDYHQL